MNELFNGMLGKIAPGMCRLSMDGGIAIKTSNGYRTYDGRTGRLTNCSSFVFDIGEEFFFVMPTNKVKTGDIILANGKPKCVVEVKEYRITAVNYEDSTLEQIIPERYIFMGNTYFYGKVVSMFGNGMKKGKKPGNIMKYMMLSQMMKGKGGGLSDALPLLMMGGSFGDGLFEGLFDEEDPEDAPEAEKDSE
ncbi:MAG: hypothetical protein J6O73_17150 [Lachnospiraceae bacterium]|nr:hypothetical protein [Lachnospiraceae bacterium]